MPLKDRIEWQEREDTSITPGWLVKELPSRGGPRKRLNAPLRIETKFTPVRARAGDVAKITALKFGALLKSGLKPGEAAHRLHTSISKLMKNPNVLEEVQHIVEEYNLPADARRLLQRAMVNKGVLEQAGEKGDPKLLLDYLKLLAADKEVGINDGPQVNVHLPGLDPALKGVLDAEIVVPALPAAEEPKKE